MADEPPLAGTVLRYRYLWRREAEGGDRAGRKDRPAAVMLSRAASGETVAYGQLSKAFFTRVLFQVQTLVRARLVERVGR